MAREAPKTSLILRSPPASAGIAYFPSTLAITSSKAGVRQAYDG